MKKSVEILGLPIISITEGRELGLSKSLLIDAKNGAVAALTIEDEDWFRGVKLIPYESIIAIGEDAVTITHSENILNLDEAGDYERLLVENIRVIGTKAITKSGRIQGKVSEVFIGDGGRIEACEITTPDGAVNEVTAAQISIFGKQVTVVDLDEEKKNSLTEPPAFEPAFETFSKEPERKEFTLAVEEPTPESVEKFMTPEPIEIEPAPAEVEPAPDQVESAPDQVESAPAEVESAPAEVEPAPAEVESAPAEVEPAPDQVESAPDQVESAPAEVESAPAEVEPAPDQVEPAPAEVEPAPDQVESAPVPVVEKPAQQPTPSEEQQKLASITQQAEDLKAALQKARAKKQAAASAPATAPASQLSQRKQVEKAVDERRRRVLLGKHATKTITAESGTIVVEVGAEVTEEVLQRARLSNKFIELSMNVQ